MVKKRKKEESSVVNFSLSELNSTLKGINKYMKTNKKFLGNQIEGLKKTFGNYEEPYSEIRQTQKGMDIKIKLPEVKKKNITINITETQIEIKAKSKQQKFSKIYHRIIDIPKCSLNKKTKADYKKGVLKIKVPYQKWK